MRKDFKIAFNKDDVVGHPIFGEGVVVATRWEGAEAQVSFRSGLCIWLPAKWLKVLTIKPVEIDQVAAKRLLEAFRLGVVPHQDIELFTFGRQLEINEFNGKLDALRKGVGDSLVVEGAYGSGKTHLLEYYRHYALRKGFVTTYCELSTQESPLYRPKRVYRELVYNLRYINNERELGYRDLLTSAAELGMDDHCFFTPLLRRIKQMQDADLSNEVFWQWMEGESTKQYAIDPSAPFRVHAGHKIPALYDFSTAADFYCYIITGLSAIVKMMGLDGLVLIFDEVETLTHIWNYNEYIRGLNFLEGLIRSIGNDPELSRIDSKLVHNRVRPTPYIYGDPAIVAVFAMTPIHGFRGIDNIIEMIRGRFYLRRFSKSELEALFQSLYKVYQTAYPDFSVKQARKENVFNAAMKTGSGELREFIKFSIEAFDWLRLAS